MTIPDRRFGRISTVLRGTALGLALLLLCSAGPVGAQEPSGVQVTEDGVLLNFQDADLRVVISALAELAGLTVVYSGLPSVPVTLRSAAPVPRSELRPMLEGLVRANGLAIVEEEGFLRIVALGAPGTVPGEEEQGGAATLGEGGIGLYVYRLHHARAELVAQTLRELFGLGGLSPVTGAPALDVGAPVPEPLGRQRLPLPPGAGFFEERETPAAPAPPVREPSGIGLAAQVQGQVQIVPDATTNSLLIRASPTDYATIQAAIEQVDIRPLQVLIEVLIAEVRRTRDFDLGVDVTVPDQALGDEDAIIGGELRGQSAGDLTLRVLGLGGIEADVVLRALAASSNVSILSRPVVLAKNNQQARILVGSERPFVQLFRSLPTDAAIRDQIVQYRDVGTELTIRPNINPDGYVTLYVLQEVSNATSEFQFGAPVISTREAETELVVRDGHTVVIGGLIDNQRESVNSGIPLLKDIPLLGALFRSTQIRRARTELFLFITPHVLRLDHDLDTVTRELEESTRELRKRVPNPVPLIERTGPVQRERRRP